MEVDTVRLTLDDLLRECHAAYGRMSVKNSHRQLISHCAQVLIQQARMIVELEAQAKHKPAETIGLVLTDG